MNALSFAAIRVLVAVGVNLLAVPIQVLDGDTERAVRAVLSTQQADWNRGDLDAFLLGYWRSDKVVFQSGGERSYGWETIRARYQRRYKDEGAVMGKLAFSDLEVEALSSDSALARGRWRLTMPDGKTPAGLFTVILRKFPEGWKIVHDHTSSEP